MFNAIELYNMIETLRVSRSNVSQNQLIADCGLKRGIMSNLMKGSMPSVDKIAAIADYFGVSVDFLIGRETNIAPAETSRGELAEMLMNMSKDEIERLIAFARFLLSERQGQAQTKEK